MATKSSGTAFQLRTTEVYRINLQAQQWRFDWMIEGYKATCKTQWQRLFQASSKATPQVQSAKCHWHGFLPLHPQTRKKCCTCHVKQTWRTSCNIQTLPYAFHQCVSGTPRRAKIQKPATKTSSQHTLYGLGPGVGVTFAGKHMQK